MKTPVTVKLEKIGSRFMLLTVENNNEEIFYDDLHTNITCRLDKYIGNPTLYSCKLDIGTVDGDDIAQYENTENRDINFSGFAELLKQYKPYGKHKTNNNGDVFEIDLKLGG